MSQTEFEPTGASLTLAFPGLAATGPLTLELTLDADAVGTGSVRQGDETIADISGTLSFESPLAFDWCASL